MPKEQYPVRIAAHKTRTKHDIGKTPDNGLKQVIIFFRVIFKIGILYNQVFTSRIFYAGMQGRTFSFIDFVLVILDVYFLLAAI